MSDTTKINTHMDQKESDMSNVINFPKKFVNDFPTSAKAARESLDEIRSAYIIEFSMFVSEMVEAQLEASGFGNELSDECQEEYWMFLVDTIAATVSRRKGFAHPMHDLILEYASGPVEDEPEVLEEPAVKPKKPRKKKASKDKETVKTE